MFPSPYTLVTTFLLATATALHASPVPGVVIQDVWNPQITSPKAGDVWVVGESRCVTWDTSDMPPEKVDDKSRVVLGFLENDSENLDLDNPLAEGFAIKDGRVTITVPDKPPRDNYFVVLFGDSGNTSPEFSIVPTAS